MLSIKLNRDYSLDLKFKIIDKITHLFEIVNRKELYFSDYSFEKVDESTVIEYESNLLQKHLGNDRLNNDKFISIEFDLKNEKVLKTEINPKVSRDKVRNCSHIDFTIIGEPNLEIYFDDKKKNRLKLDLDIFKDKIAEFYFYDLEKGDSCYTDIINRGFEKQNKFDKFSRELNSDRIEASSTESKNEVRFYGEQFMEEVFNNYDYYNHYSKNNNLDVFMDGGSLVIGGKDKAKVLKKLKEDMNEYINNQLKKNSAYNFLKKKYSQQIK